MSSCMSPETMNVAIIAGIEAHLGPIIRAQKPNVGLYIVGRSTRLTMRFHLLPQKSCSELERYGSSKCGSSSTPFAARARAVVVAKIRSRMRV
ncbi:hypothetical protein G4B88_009801 [Cannabis sativa]|uniref:Uncharacterized protein n=1 Tax=Cannabis sativa TaxID=3483 RepID=A0A7J6E2T5_CANSA|nr:hypothetical protein G4B88_009801 [Cannabis sativa]